MHNFDVIIVGAGFAGAVCARKLADSGKRVLILEKREHLAGNMYDYYDSQGVLVHKYGPHIFHTNSKQAFNFIKPFSDWYKYEHKVQGYIEDKYVPIPFNFTSTEALFEKEIAEGIKKKLKQEFGDTKKVSVLELLESKDENIKKFGEYVFENVFAKYTAKQWGISIDKVDKTVINRVPVLLNYDDRYFQDNIQYMPKNGFTKLFENMLDHENIKIRFSIKFNEGIKYDDERNVLCFQDRVIDVPVIYTGALDELFKYKFGFLPYRSLDLIFEKINKTVYQPAAVVNYTVTEDFTRITEFKYLTGQVLDNKTTILKEFPHAFNPEEAGSVPYYPIIEEKNISLYNKYRGQTESMKNLYICGRLADYSYYNMDAVIERALVVAERVLFDTEN